MGLLDLEPVDVKGTKVVPRDAFIASVQPKLTKPKGRDLVALRIIVRGTKGGKPASRTFDLVDRYDEQHEVSAMMRTTGYSLSITGLMQVRGQVKPAGVHTPDECIPAAEYIAELRKRGIDIKES
jgi:lysine 6-dehydrogenase